MIFREYLSGLQAILERLKSEQAENIRQAGQLVAAAIAADGVVHTFGAGHSHLIAEEAFFRAGGIAAVNPILDERLVFLRGALESTRAEREEGFARALLDREDVRAGDVAIVISNSGRNTAPVEMALEMKSRAVRVIAITSLEHSSASASLHPSGKRLFEIADLTVDNGVPSGDALLRIPGLDSKIGPSSTVAGAAAVNSIVIEAASELAKRGLPVPLLPSANSDGVTVETLRAILGRYHGRIRYLDV
jgi:uncharacterized phosphosugar-binding protein